MDKRVLETILVDQAEELAAKRAVHFCRRREEDSIDLESSQAQVVIGVRRSGKSTLCFNALTRSGVKFAYVNFDDERLIQLTANDLNDVLEVLYKIYGNFSHLFIDEIQNIPEWYLFVNRLLRRQMHVVITGSNAKLLSGELATHLTGRHHAITLYPFSFAEFCGYRGVNTEDVSTRATAERRAAFDDYMRQGGFPELQLVSNKRDYVSQLVNNILQRDIEQRFKVVHTGAFEQMAHHLLNEVPAVVSESTLCDTFELRSPHTVKNYLSYLKQAYILVGLHKYSPKSRVRITGEKVYPIDVALMNGRGDAFAGPNWGWRLESIVYLELLRRYQPQGRDIYYYCDRSGECDFVVCSGREAELAVQVSYDISAERTLRREVAGLLLAARKTGCRRLLLLTDNQRMDLEEAGLTIAVRPVHEWVLEG
jgi:predicted AAA+ superfamily ATPase